MATTTRTGRLVHLDERRQTELDGVGRASHSAYVVTDNGDGTLVFTPPDLCDDPHLAQMKRSELEDLFKRDSSERLGIAGDPAADTAAVRLACLALRQAGLWGPPYDDVEVAHPRFTEAVEAAAAASDERQALAAATAILEAPEAFDSTP